MGRLVSFGVKLIDLIQTVELNRLGVQLKDEKWYEQLSKIGISFAHTSMVRSGIHIWLIKNFSLLKAVLCFDTEFSIHMVATTIQTIIG